MKRSLGLGICFVLVASGIGLPLVIASAAVTSGTKCMKAGANSVYAGKKYTCIKLGKKLYWNNGALIRKPVARVSPSPTKKVNPKQVAPLQLSPTYSGIMSPLQPYSSSCWLAKEVTNSSTLMSPRFEVRENVINKDGQAFSAAFYSVPSLPPGASMWMANLIEDCNEDMFPLRTILVTNEPSSDKSYSVYKDHLLTDAKELPKVTSTTLTQYKDWVGYQYLNLKIENISANKYLNLGTTVHLVLFNAKGIPVGSFLGRLSGTLAPGGIGSAFMSTGYKDEYAFKVPSETVKIEVGLAHKLCLEANSDFECWY